MPTDEELLRTMNGIREDVKTTLEKHDTKIDNMNTTLASVQKDVAVFSERQEGHERRLVKVESKSIAPTTSGGLSQKTVTAAAIAIATAVLGGGGYAVNYRAEAAASAEQATDRARYQAQREALAAMARAMAQSQKAQRAGVEAAVTLDSESAEEAKRAAEKAAIEALRAEQALQRDP